MFCTLNFAQNNYDSYDKVYKRTFILRREGRALLPRRSIEIGYKSAMNFCLENFTFTIFSRKEICAWCNTAFNFITIYYELASIEYRAHKTPDIDSLVGTMTFFGESRRAAWTRPKLLMYDNNYSKMLVRTSEATMTFREEKTTVIADGVAFVFVRPRSFLRTYGEVVWWVSLVAARSFSRARRVLWAERLAEKEPHSGPATRIL